MAHRVRGRSQSGSYSHSKRQRVCSPSRTSAPATPQPVGPTSSLGIDFGTHCSKGAKAIRTENGRVEIHRVVPPRSQQADTSAPFEFDSIGALGYDEKLGPKVLLGRDAAGKDLVIYLKTLFVYMAGIRSKKKLEALPGWLEISTAMRLKKLTKPAIEAALRAHFMSMRDAAKHAEESSGIRTDRLVFTYPNYLCQEQGAKDMLQYLDYYERWIDEVWPEIKPECRFAISEGQAAAIYATEDFDDPLASISKEQRRKVFEGLRRTGCVNLLVADCGGSSLNLQVVNVYLAPDGSLEKIQLSIGQNWSTGTKGGSDFANSEVLRLVERELQALVGAGNLKPGDLEAFVRDWELKKRRLDWQQHIDNDEYVILHGPHRSVVIEPERLANIMVSAFGEGTRALGKMVTELRNLGKDFAVLLMGGSFGISGFRNSVEAQIRAVKPRHEQVINYAFIDENETWPKSAVSVGAALSVMRMPHPVEVLKKSAIGLQRVSRSLRTSEKPEKDTKGLFLMSPGCMELEPQILNMSFLKKFSQDLDLLLVCDPTYVSDRRKGDLRIGTERKVLNGPFGTYELGWGALENASPGYLRLGISGIHMDRFAAGDVDPASYPSNGIPFVFSRCRVHPDSLRRFPHDIDQKWVLLVRVDPGTKLACIKELHRLPHDCKVCGRELVAEACVCQAPGCDMVLCRECYAKPPSEAHSCLHEGTRVVLDPVLATSH